MGGIQPVLAQIRPKLPQGRQRKANSQRDSQTKLFSYFISKLHKSQNTSVVAFLSNKTE